jgi:hypothetical protein
MVGHPLVIEQHNDALGMRAYQHHPPSSSGVDAVTVMIRHNQAGGRGTHRFLDEAMEWPAQFHQARPLVLEYIPDRPVLELRLVGSPGVGDALIFQPGVQLNQALHPRLGTEQQIAQIADLVLDLSVRATYAAFGHGSPEPQPAAGVHATGSIR